LAALATAAPAAATVPDVGNDPAKAYVAARAAAISGDHVQAAEIYARLAATSNEAVLKQKAVSEAVSAGDIPLALRLVHQLPQGELSVDSRILLVAEALKRGDNSRALQLLGQKVGDADLSFWSPLVQSWNAADRRDFNSALSILAQIPRNSALSPFIDEESALIALKLGKTPDAEPYARRAIGGAGPREYRLRLALAAGFQAAGDKARALAMLDGISGDTTNVRRALDAGQLRPLMIDTAAKAFSEQLVALGIEMKRAPNGVASPVNILQIARFAAPENSSEAILLGNFLADDDRLADALAQFHSVPAGDPLKSEALDSESRALTAAKRYPEALALATQAASAPGATSDDFARLADVYSAMKRYNEAAAAYEQAISRAPNAPKAQLWPLLLLQANALESANRWPEAKAALATAIAMSPNEPLVLNFLGYAKLEHGEDLDAAEAMIRKANQLAPDDASITDSLGWALYKRGRVDEAIDILQKAAAGDPAQADIQEHLGDALYTAGRRFEARFAWSAALATADEEETARLKSKIEAGLTKATAAP
jgi:tetratricopeptide (TPR) repeat protein